MSQSLYEKLKKENLTIQVMLVGSSGVGKSSIINRYISNQFSTNSVPTIGMDFLDKKLRYKDKNIKIQLWDTSGQDLYKSACSSRLKRSNCIIFVYSMAQKEREKTIADILGYWMTTANEQCGLDTIFCVFGNKTDMVEDQNQIEIVKKQIEQKLKARKDKLIIQLVSAGNCKQPENKAIQQMMNKIIEISYLKRVQKQKSQLIEMRKSIEKGEQPKEHVQSIKLTTQSHRNSLEQKKKKKSCFFF